MIHRVLERLCQSLNSCGHQMSTHGNVVVDVQVKQVYFLTLNNNIQILSTGMLCPCSERSNIQPKGKSQLDYKRIKCSSVCL